MTGLGARIGALERLAPAGSCPVCSGASELRLEWPTVDGPGYEPGDATQPPERCPACGRERRTIRLEWADPEQRRCFT